MQPVVGMGGVCGGAVGSGSSRAAVHCSGVTSTEWHSGCGCVAMYAEGSAGLSTRLWACLFKS